MKIKTLNTVKYSGAYTAPGTVLDVPEDVANALIEAKAAVLLTEPKQPEPASPAPAPAKAAPVPAVNKVAVKSSAPKQAVKNTKQSNRR